MKKASLVILTILITHCIQAQDLAMTQRWIKVGNSLREAHQFEQGETYLLRGLKSAQILKNNYWQGVASEYLGLLYMNTNEMVSAGQYLNAALRFYQGLRLNLSAKVVKDLMNDHNISSEQTWQYYGGIEVGSKGVKYSIIKVRRKEGRLAFIYLKDGSRNTQIIDFSPSAIKETSEAVKAFMDSIAQYSIKVPADNIFVAVSSGVKQEADKVAGREEQLRKALVEQIPTYGRHIEFLNACQEGDLTIKGIIPASYLYASSLMDIGSGNTKGGYRTKGENTIACVTIPWGTSTFAKKIAGKSTDFATQYFQDSIKPVLVNEIARKPGLTNRQIAYYSGGIFWAMCNYLHPENVTDDFTEFTLKDVDKFLNDATNNYDVLINPDLSRINNTEMLQEAKKQIARTQTTFNKDNIIAGALIIKGILSEMERLGSKEKSYAFARFGYVGWISGYIVTKIDNDFNTVKD